MLPLRLVQLLNQLLLLSIENVGRLLFLLSKGKVVVLRAEMLLLLKLLLHLSDVEAVDSAQVVQHPILIHLTHADPLVHVVVKLFLQELDVVTFKVHFSALDPLLELKVVIWVVEL